VFTVSGLSAELLDGEAPVTLSVSLAVREPFKKGEGLAKREEAQ
jgi:hypothetical protein